MLGPCVLGCNMFSQTSRRRGRNDVKNGNKHKTIHFTFLQFHVVLQNFSSLYFSLEKALFQESGVAGGERLSVAMRPPQAGRAPQNIFFSVISSLYLLNFPWKCVHFFSIFDKKSEIFDFSLLSLTENNFHHRSYFPSLCRALHAGPLHPALVRRQRWHIEKHREKSQMLSLFMLTLCIHNNLIKMHTISNILCIQC